MKKVKQIQESYEENTQLMGLDIASANYQQQPIDI